MNEGKGPPQGPCLAMRGSQGLCLQAPPDYAIHQGFVPDPSKTIKCLKFSPDGQKLAWSNGGCVQISTVGSDGNWSSPPMTIDHPKAYSIAWSPLGNILASWEMYATIQGKDPTPNLHIWDVKTGEKLKSFFQKKHANWCPIWSPDEKICSRMVNNEVQFYENGDFHNIQHKIHLAKVCDFGLSPSRDAPHVLTYVPGLKGAPSFARLYAYPKFADNQVVANKSFMIAEKVELKWNGTGSSVLLLTSTETDKTGATYYGRQQLHHLSTKGDSAMVGLSKEGPIYSHEWSPTGKEFVVVYGYMPAKATLFDSKADPLFEFGTGPRSIGLFNPQGNILMIGGFGNLRGKVEMWDVSNAKSADKLSDFDAPDTTDVKWSPDGQHLMTSSCAPRLRVGNGYKVWHYSGSLMHEITFKDTDELWEVDWQPSKYRGFKASKRVVEGIAPSQPKASKQAYRPPGARGTASTFKLHDNDILPQNAVKKDPENMSKAAIKNMKRKEAAKKKKEEEAAAEAQSGKAAALAAAAAQSGKVAASASTGDPDKDKKLRKLNDKLASIQKLKQDQAEGKQLEANQLEKIKTESAILKDIQILKELKELKL